MITNVAIEVLLQIAGNLTTPEYGNLRRTCKAMEAALFPYFSQEFFTKKQFMVSEFSLQALVDISKSRLSPSLVHVIIGLDQVVNEIRITPNHLSIPEYIKSNERAFNYNTTETFLSTAQDIEMLAEAFSNLSNLETVGLRDFYSVSRNRDYPQQDRWRSYGVGTFEQAGGVIRMTDDAPDRDIHALHYHHQRFLNTLIALGKSGARPKHYEVILRNNTLSEQAFNVPHYAKRHVLPVLANLHTIFLDIGIGWEIMFTRPDTKTADPERCSCYFLKSFLGELSQLQHLRLNFPRDAPLLSFRIPEGTTMLDWLSKPDFAFTTTPQKASPFPPIPSMNCPNLRRLDIGMASAQVHLLINVLKRFENSLRELSLHKVALTRDSVEDDPPVNLWANFFDQLSVLDRLKLTTIAISDPRHSQKPWPAITFTGARRPTVKKWVGVDMRSGLRDFKKELVVTRR